METQIRIINTASVGQGYRVTTLIAEGYATLDEVENLMTDPLVLKEWVKHKWNLRNKDFLQQSEKNINRILLPYNEIRKQVIQMLTEKKVNIKDSFHAVTEEQISQVLAELKAPKPIKTAKQIKQERDERNRNKY
jgi:hypothetical protein